MILTIQMNMKICDNLIYICQGSDVIWTILRDLIHCAAAVAFISNSRRWWFTVLPDKSLPGQNWWRLLNNFKGFNPLCSSRRLHPQLKKLVVVGAQFSENETNKSSQQRLVDYQVGQHMTDWLLLQEWDKLISYFHILTYILLNSWNFRSFTNQCNLFKGYCQMVECSLICCIK